MLVDPTDMSEDVRVLFYLEHTIQDASIDTTGKRREVSRQLQFIERDAHGNMRTAGYAPFLDYRPLSEEEYACVSDLRAAPWLTGDLEEQARSYAITELVPRHLASVRQRREEQIDKTGAAVNERLTKEISYWDNRAAILKAQETAGKTNARLNSQIARQRAEELLARLERRLDELEQERKLSPLPPVVVGGVLVVPQGLLNKLTAREQAPRHRAVRPRNRSRRTPGHGSRDANRAPPWLYPTRCERRQMRLRHRVQHPQHRQTALPRSQRARQGAATVIVTKERRS